MKAKKAKGHFTLLRILWMLLPLRKRAMKYLKKEKKYLKRSTMNSLRQVTLFRKKIAKLKKQYRRHYQNQAMPKLMNRPESLNQAILQKILNRRLKPRTAKPML